MDPSGAASQGLFFSDTRYLSQLKLQLNKIDPVLLGSSEEILFESSFLLTNPPLSDIAERGVGILWRNTIGADAVQVRITFANWSVAACSFEASLELSSDFFDTFEARGVKRLKRGEIRPPQFNADTLRLSYLGLDNVTRTTTIKFKPEAGGYTDNTVTFPISLEAGERTSIELEISMHEDAPKGTNVRREPKEIPSAKPVWFDKAGSLVTSNALVEAIIDRSTADLEVLLTEYLGECVPAAGLPRFAVPFGRDCCITALETLVWNPNLARDVLFFLAKTQGKAENPWNYEQPGKIMHEMHTGELARLKEIPFGLFYGSVDSTPLFLILAGEYIRWTQDLDIYRKLKPNFDAAWKWIDDYGNIDGSGYLQYKAHTPPKMSSAALTVGLFNQGWKDSANSVVYADGRIATDHPIALAEVQGDLYRALTIWSEVYCAMPESEGMARKGQELRARADTLKEQFNREFWMPDQKYFAEALDGSHHQVNSVTSNPAECLWARLIDDDKAQAVADMVLSESMSTSWGIRTMANNQAAYNPFSYHNGSVWPFENALIASGLKKYGLLAATEQIFNAMLDASLYFEYRRWPEVYCGVSKSVGGVLARQPDASRPQAWSAGAIFLLLQTLLGIAPQPFSKRVNVTPALPESIEHIVARDLPIAGGHLSLRVVRAGEGVLLEIMDNPDNLDVLIHPAMTYHAGGTMATSK
jgi:glycogen debranching enzyme